MEAGPHLFTFYSAEGVLRSLIGNVWLAIAHPVIFAKLLSAALRSRSAFVRLLRFPIDLATIRNSPLFDRGWYAANHPELARSRITPELHYLLHETPDGRWASPAFSGDAYLKLNPEVIASGVNPLVHYEQYGRFIGCPATPTEANRGQEKFPEGTVEIDSLLGESPRRHMRTAIYATHAPDGVIVTKDIFYLRGLKEVCDNIVVVASSPVFPEELGKLSGVASAVICRIHGGYDFGSYRIGLRVARERGWITPEACRELVFANASCYAPVRPFADMFAAMERRRKADFWGLTFNTQRSGKPHLQSFFLVFRRAVLDAGALESFFAERPERATRNEAINLYEIQLTAFLRDRGFVPDAFVRPLLPRLHEFNPTTRPIDLILRHKSPLVKVKALRGETSQPPERIVECVKQLNPELAAIMEVSVPPRPPVSRKDQDKADITSATGE